MIGAWTNPEEKLKKDREAGALQSKSLQDRQDMQGLFALLKLIFGQFGMTGEDGVEIEPDELVGDLTEDEIVHSAVFRSELKNSNVNVDDFYKNYEAHKVSPQTVPYTGVFSEASTSDAALRATLSLGIERYTKQSMDRGVGYKLGAKGEGNKIDCSGFVDKSIKNAMNAALPEGCKSLSSTFTTHSDGQVSGLAQKTGFMLSGADVNLSNLKAGMVIGIDSGDNVWDRGRQNGIDHVGIVYADSQTGKLMFAESRGGKGVDTTPLDEWLKKAEKEKYSLFASDVVKLASDDYKKQVAQRVEMNTEAKAQAQVSESVKPQSETVVASSQAKPPEVIVSAASTQYTTSLFGKPV